MSTTYAIPTTKNLPETYISQYESYQTYTNHINTYPCLTQTYIKLRHHMQHLYKACKTNTTPANTPPGSLPVSSKNAR